MSPLSEFVCSGRVAGNWLRCSGGKPTTARSTGAMKRVKVKLAEVGNPGKIAAGVPSNTARQSGLPGLSATP